MKSEVPLEKVFRAIIPTPREAQDKPCDCPSCFEERAREKNRAAWRATR